jgi:glycosyltransferase involved in cell wall biosynthesis
MSDTVYPLVSVVIAFLNEERFLAEAIESVLSQDYHQWQLLLVDDGSIDRSTTIAKRYADKFIGKIIYCEHEGHINKGLSASRNYGIQQGTGELIAILDADDFWQPNKLSDQVKIFQKFINISMVAEASLYWYSWEDTTKGDVIMPIGVPANKIYQPTELLTLLYPLGKAAAPCPSGLMMKKQVWLEVGRFEESFLNKYQLYEDQAFLSKIYLKKKVYISSFCNNLYRQRSDSLAEKIKKQGGYHDARKYFLEWLLAYLRDEDLLSIKLKFLLVKALLPYHNRKAYNIIKIFRKQVRKAKIILSNNNLLGHKPNSRAGLIF